MVQRAVTTQKCMVCGGRSMTKAAMREHIESFHGVNWAPNQMAPVKDQMEFKPGVSTSSPWGKDFR